MGVVKIEIYFSRAGARANLVGSCTNRTTCVVTVGPYVVGDYQLVAYAWDAAGNKGTSTTIAVHVYN